MDCPWPRTTLHHSNRKLYESINLPMLLSISLPALSQGCIKQVTWYRICIIVELIWQDTQIKKVLLQWQQMVCFMEMVPTLFGIIAQASDPCRS